MTWTEILTYIVMPVLALAVIPIVVFVFGRLNNHGERLVKVETEISGLSGNVKDIKRETRTQTKMLYRVLGKLGIGVTSEEIQDDQDGEGTP